jgi:Co/Zn/Cd efflux system component/predicted transcriptional regulator
MRERRHKGEFHEFILMALLGKGPLRYQELWDTFMQLTSHFTMGSRYFTEWGQSLSERVRRFISRFGLRPERERTGERRPREREREPVEPEFRKTLLELSRTGQIHLNENEEYELTDPGKRQAEKYKKDMEKGAEIFRDHILSPTATARNTVIVDLFLASIKLISGFVSGSVALIADGADATIDTASAVVVWAGIRFGKEHLGTVIIVLMMFVTGLTVGYESLTKLYGAITSTIDPIAKPYLVIVVELVALISAVMLTFYQRYVGKSNGNLSLISQSVDSKNHIYVAGVVILGAIFSTVGIHFVDPLIGVYIAVRILKDAIALAREAISSLKGEETDFSAYRMPFEKHYKGYKTESFRSWILYSMLEDGLRTGEELIASLEKVFKPKYVPILSEFGYSLGEGMDFKTEFNALITPLLDKGYLAQDGDSFELTPSGKRAIERWIREMRFYATS